MIKRTIIGVQMLFVAFGALVLVPLLTGLDASVALFTAGIGTIAFHLITGIQLPVFLASSFAYIGVISASIKMFGLPSTLGGLMAAGLVKMLFGGIIRIWGVDFIKKVLPSVVIGPVIMVIGLNLAPIAGDMIKNSDGHSFNMLIALVALSVTIAVSVFGRGFFRLTPILFGITAGYITALFFGEVNFEVMKESAWFSIPNFTLPAFNWKAILLIVPVAIAPAIEHIGDVMVISNIVDKDFTKKPGLHRTLLGDGVATFLASFFGGPPNTTYSEVTGAVAITKTKDPIVMIIAACTAIILAFFGKLGGFLKTIPAPVMGGIMIVLFGTIAAVGIKNMLENKVDLSSTRNLIIVAVILVVGIGDIAFSIQSFQLAGIGLSAVIGIILNLVLPRSKESEDEVETSEFEDL